MSSASPLTVTSQPTSSQPSAVEKKVYEPSMEEILASIRRIIADDQSLPGRGATSEAFASPLPQAAPQPTPVEQMEDAPEPARRLETPAAHGSVAAPQFAMPHPVRTPAEPVVHPTSTVHPTVVVTPPPEKTVEPAPVQAAAPTAYVAPEHQPDPEPEAASDSRTDAAYEAVEEAAFVSEEPDAHLDAAALYDAPIAPPQAETEPLEASPAVEPPQVGTEHLSRAESPAAETGAGLFSAATDSSVASAFNLLAASRLADNSDELMNLAREMIRPLLRTWIDDNLPSMVERMVRAEIERVARGGR